MSEILIIDDEANVRRMLSGLLAEEGFRCREAATGPEGVRAVEAREPDLVLLDLILPEMGGLEVLKRIHGSHSDLPVVMMSGKATLADAVEATKLGAFQFIEKPFTPEAVLTTLRSALELRRARDRWRVLQEELRPGEAFVGESRAMQEVRELARRVAATDARVVITGESGTGKELVALLIHALSHRREGPFVRVNCAAIPRDLVESEMFGHEKGAFTGATERRRGKFELAHGGTLFLDEVSDLGPEAQAKLLHAVERGEIQRVGGSEEIKVDVRVIAATNRRLEEEVERGRFRDDLYFRLHLFAIHIPPLRERREDVPIITAQLLDRFRARQGLRGPILTESAIGALQAYDWPGNVRELANVVERLMILYPDREIGAVEVRSALPHAVAASGPTLRPDGRPLSRLLDDYERHLIETALQEAGGNVAEAARRLSTDRPNLYRRMRRLGIPRPSTGA